jgi:hypothetical protein
MMDTMICPREFYIREVRYYNEFIASRLNVDILHMWLQFVNQGPGTWPPDLGRILYKLGLRAWYVRHVHSSLWWVLVSDALHPVLSLREYLTSLCAGKVCNPAPYRSKPPNVDQKTISCSQLWLFLWWKSGALDRHLKRSTDRAENWKVYRHVNCNKLVNCSLLQKSCGWFWWFEQGNWRMLVGKREWLFSHKYSTAGSTSMLYSQRVRERFEIWWIGILGSSRADMLH